MAGKSRWRDWRTWLLALLGAILMALTVHDLVDPEGLSIRGWGGGETDAASTDDADG